jgi:hypothetical protein
MLQVGATGMNQPTNHTRQKIINSMDYGYRKASHNLNDDDVEINGQIRQNITQFGETKV